MNDWPSNLDVADMHDIIHIVSGSLTRQYAGYVTTEDIDQELLLWCWKKREKVAEYLDRADADSRKSGSAALMKSLFRHGARYCRKEKAAQSGYEPSDEYFYSPAQVEEIIKIIHAGGTAYASRGMTDGRGIGDPAEGGNLAVMVADITAALELVDARTRALLLTIHGDGTPASAVAEVEGVTPQAVSARAKRGVVAVINKLGGESPYR